TTNQIPGATGTSILVSPQTTTNYWVQVNDTTGPVNSNTATVTVGSTTTAPVITTQPTSPPPILAGQQATPPLNVTASGNPTPTFQWYTGNSGNTTNPISGATTSSYPTPPLASTTSYWVRATNSAGTADSNTATVTVNTN